MSKVKSSAGPTERRQVLVIDDAEGIRSYLRNLLTLRGFEVLLAEGGGQALELLKAGARPQVVILDVMMPKMDGLTTLGKIHELQPDIPVIMLSVVGKASSIVEAMNAGAADYLNKPFEEEELDLAIRKVLEHQSLREEREELRQRLAEQDAKERTRFLWASEKMTQIKEVLEQVADADVTVLIHGESGVGKEVVARTLHDLSDRSAKTPMPSGASDPDPEVSATAQRRRFPAAYRLRILKEADACKKPGEVGAPLRREGLYSSLLTNWRRQLEAGALREMRGRRRGPTPRPVDPRVKQLETENRRLQRKLQRAETIITLQKKVAEILGIPLTPLDDDETD